MHKSLPVSTATRKWWAGCALLFLGACLLLERVWPAPPPAAINVEPLSLIQVPIAGAVQWPEYPYRALVMDLVCEPANPLALTPAERDVARAGLLRLNASMADVLYCQFLLYRLLGPRQHVLTRQILNDGRVRTLLPLKPLDYWAGEVLRGLDEAAGGRRQQAKDVMSALFASYQNDPNVLDDPLELTPRETMEMLRRVQQQPVPTRLEGARAARAAAVVRRLVISHEAMEAEWMSFVRPTRTDVRSRVIADRMAANPRQDDVDFIVVARAARRSLRALEGKPPEGPPVPGEPDEPDEPEEED